MGAYRINTKPLSKTELKSAPLPASLKEEVLSRILTVDSEVTGLSHKVQVLIVDWFSVSPCDPAQSRLRKTRDGPSLAYLAEPPCSGIADTVILPVVISVIRARCLVHHNADQFGMVESLKSF